MSDNNIEQIPMKSVADLQGYKFIIPSQQRGYKWTTSNIEELIKDFLVFLDKGDGKRVYCLQPLAVVRRGEEYIVLDGQQRLTTIFLLYKALFNENLYEFEFERDRTDDFDDESMNRWDFMNSLTGEINNKTVDQFFISTAYSKILELTKDHKIADKLRGLLKADREHKSIQVIWYEVSEEKSHETFRNLNSGKIPLSNSDLIKALFLNRVSGLKAPLRQQAADLLEQMEQELKNDSFWYMFNVEENPVGQSRMDFIYNLVADCREDDYAIEPRWSFRNFFDNRKVKDSNGDLLSLEDKWTQVRHVYLRLRGMYEDPYLYHYIGFLTYCKDNDCKASALLKYSRSKSSSGFIRHLREAISKKIKRKAHDKLSDYSYDSPKPLLRQLFLIYNIETILFRYEQVRNNNELMLKGLFERFPFELLHKQQWDIEHIASKTENDMTSISDQQDWLKSIKADLGHESYKEISCDEEEHAYWKNPGRHTFEPLYHKIMEYCESKLGDLAIPDKVEDNSDRKDKNQLGNLTLLDRHTNRSFHNSLFPRKRKIVLVAGGLESSDKDDGKIRRVFVPLCTRQCFTKSYRRSSDVNLNAWIQTDADAYYDDINLKLDKYFNNGF